MTERRDVYIHYEMHDGHLIPIVSDKPMPPKEERWCRHCRRKQPFMPEVSMRCLRCNQFICHECIDRLNKLKDEGRESTVDCPDIYNQHPK